VTYAVAELAGDPLFAIRDDFPQTELEFGDGIVGYWADTINQMMIPMAGLMCWWAWRAISASTISPVTRLRMSCR
jgi:hypothetical protein